MREQKTNGNDLKLMKNARSKCVVLKLNQIIKLIIFKFNILQNEKKIFEKI